METILDPLAVLVRWAEQSHAVIGRARAAFDAAEPVGIPSPQNPCQSLESESMKGLPDGPPSGTND